MRIPSRRIRPLKTTGRVFDLPALFGCILIFGIVVMVMSETRSEAAFADNAELVKWETITLDNGMRAFLEFRDGLPMVAAELRIPAGSLFDPQGREGLANLTARTIRLGSVYRDAEEVDLFLDSRGASLSVGVTADYVSFSIVSLAEDFPAVANLLAEILLNPAFEEGEFARTRDEWIARIRRSYGSGGVLAAEAFMHVVFPHMGYGRPSSGYPSTVSKVEIDDLDGFYGSHYKPNGAQLTVVGPIKTGELLELVHDAFGSWAPGIREPIRLDDRKGESGRVVIVDAPLNQATVRVGHRAPFTAHPDFFKLRFVNEVLGASGLASRLADAVRNERGLAYSVYSWNTGFRAEGTFFISFATKVESAREALDVALAELESLLADGPTDEEIERARAGLLGRLYFGLETYGGAAGFIAGAEFSGLGSAYFERYIRDVKAMDSEEFRRIANKYINPGEFVTVIAGPADELETQFSDFPVEVVRIPE